MCLLVRSATRGSVSVAVCDRTSPRSKSSIKIVSQELDYNPGAVIKSDIYYELVPRDTFTRLNESPVAYQLNIGHLGYSLE